MLLADKFGLVHTLAVGAPALSGTEQEEEQGGTRQAGGEDGDDLSLLLGHVSTVTCMVSG